MFLAIQVKQPSPLPLEKIEIIVLMHGKATASSMLETAQELLETDHGKAMNMSLDMEVGQMYDQLLNYINENKEKMSNGLLLLTDMGSLNSFANLKQKEIKRQSSLLALLGKVSLPNFINEFIPSLISQKSRSSKCSLLKKKPSKNILMAC